MERFSQSLRKHEIKIVNFQKKEIDKINKRAGGIAWKGKNLLQLQKRFVPKYANDKNYGKVGDHCCYTGKGRGTARGICNSKHIIPKEITNGLWLSFYDEKYNFLIYECHHKIYDKPIIKSFNNLAE